MAKLLVLVPLKVPGHSEKLKPFQPLSGPLCDYKDQSIRIKAVLPMLHKPLAVRKIHF